jgi:hypothetical protein
MLMTLLFLAAFSIFFYLAGLLMRGVLERFGVAPSFSRVSLTGLGISLVLAALWLKFELTINYLFPTLIALGLLGLLVSLRHLQTFRITQGLHLNTLLATLAGLPIILLHQVNLLSSVFSYRTGPDSFGWATSSLTLCEGSKLSDLVSRVNSQLGETSISRSFVRFLEPGERSIAQITSYNDQISSEFLVGANRTGIQGLLGATCSNLGQEFFASMFVALAAWAFIHIFIQANEAIHGTGTFPKLRSIVALIATLNVGTLSTALEGGYGQIITLPFFLLVLNSMKWNSFQFGGFFLSLTTLIFASIAAYTDVLYLAIPFIGAYFLWGLYKKKFTFGAFKRAEYLLFGTAAFLIVLFLEALIPLVVGTFQNHPELAGWHQGKFMFPSNVFGFVSSLPVGNYVFPPRTVIGLAIDGIVSLAFLYLIMQRPLKRNFIPLLAFCGYLYLTFGVYVGVDFFNNYRIWKYSAYAALFVTYVYSNFIDSFEEGLKKYRVRTLTRASAVGLLVVATATSSIAWSLDWLESRKTTISFSAGQEIRELANSYNILGGAGVNTLTLTIFGDIKYGSPLRGAGRVVPDSNLDYLLLVPEGYECGYICKARAFAAPLTKKISSTLIYESNNFDGYLVGKDLD